MTDVFVGIGSNIRPQEHVPQALAHLEAAFGVLRVSRVYQCPAVGFDGADFVNLVVGFETSMAVHPVQEKLHAIEAACGRIRGSKQASRTMDLDLLLYGDRVHAQDGLCLPRPDILEYAFVLKPLAELVPQWRHPVEGRTYARLWADFDRGDQSLTAIDMAGVPAFGG